MPQPATKRNANDAIISRIKNLFICISPLRNSEDHRNSSILIKNPVDRCRLGKCLRQAPDIRISALFNECRINGP
ncbi:hypothetical cytosolic protein [Syntrophus aciditrophicus SB]|uniref:Hypothetical cytosolic protein n=1 Tax=Syntrophus aciditrophicus (strain SB) TaxID=56780 RepID=Q2LRE9_SYNAS|nr:hypothetical cytosolic protein [Syntrophus aciditrophicus SB]